ncbi:MAG: hypothetical protein ACR2P2_02600 [Nakamurella sp.]
MNRADREQLIEARHEAYFDLFGLADICPLVRPQLGRQSWLGYEPDFVYRYGRLDLAITWDQLAGLCVEQTRRALAYAQH